MNEVMTNQFEKNQPKKNALVEGFSSRQVQEVQAAMVVAKKFPRDQFEAFQRVMTACQRESLAKDAVYSYPRGGTRVTGPSIRLAETLAQNWGNIDFGIIELDQGEGESTMMSYAWDLETNTRQTKIFSVKHKRDTKNGSYDLTESRDIYELTANMGARRLRACILGVLPGDLIDAAVAKCEETLRTGKAPIEDRVKEMLVEFKKAFGVTKAHIEEHAGYKVESFMETDIVKFQQIYSSIRDGMSAREDYFNFAANSEEIDIQKDAVPKADGKANQNNEPKEESNAKTESQSDEKKQTKDNKEPVGPGF
jgi:hypothetical protein